MNVKVKIKETGEEFRTSPKSVQSTWIGKRIRFQGEIHRIIAIYKSNGIISEVTISNRFRR